MSRHLSIAAPIALAAAILVAQPLAASPQARLKAKTDEARSVLAQVDALNRQFEATVEAWNGARYRLGAAEHQLARDRRSLRAAQRQDRLVRARVAARLVALYESGGGPSVVSILFGSTTVSEMIAQFEDAQAVTAADHELALHAAAARRRYAAAERQSAATERARAKELALRGVERQRISRMLAERQRLLASVRSEVIALRAAEARRQAVLAAQARARLAREALERQRAQAHARAAAAAAARERTRAAAARAPVAPAAAPAPAPTTSEAVPTTTQPAPTVAAPAPAPPRPASPAASPTGGHPEAATIAARYLGVRYVWGGASPAGFDCSGLVMYVFAQLGVSLPHYAAAQYGFGQPVSRDELQPGDLVFFDGLNHVGIYIGGGEMIHAPHTGDVVKISPLSDFGAGYVGARRI